MRILVIEDDDTLREGLKAVLERAGWRPTLTGDGILGDDHLMRETFDLVVLDLGIPGMDGLTILRRMRQRGQSTPTLILSARNQAADRVRGLDLGADDYLSKPFDRDEFEARVRALLRRGKASTIEIGQLTWSLDTHQGWTDGQPLVLTRNEAVVLEALLRSQGRIVTKSALAERIGIDEEPTSDNTVEVFVYRVRRKLEPTGVRIRTVRGLGYLLHADP